VSIAAAKKFVNAQLATFEKYADGYFFWSYKGPGYRSNEEGIQYGYNQNPC
jgi:hypothetical protein